MMARFLWTTLVLLFVTPIWAQNNFEQNIKRQQSPLGMLSQEADYRATFGSTWNGHGTWMALRVMLKAGGESELGLSEEQNKRLYYLHYDGEMARDWSQRMRQNPTEAYTNAAEAVRAATPQDDPLFERATDEQKNAYVAALADALGLFIDEVQADINETLTPEQMLKVRKLELQLMPEIGLPFPSMFEPLDLTDEQKKQMNTVTDEMKAEFDRLITEGAALRGERMKKSAEILETLYKEKHFDSREEFLKAKKEADQKSFKDKSLQERQKKLDERGKKFVTLLKSRLMNVLTDEQLDKMQRILDDSPEFVKNVLAEMKKQRKTNEKSGQYVPGPDSWRPGDGTPKSFKANRKAANKAGKAFPTKE
jgi:hypothetical protein